MNSYEVEEKLAFLEWAVVFLCSQIGVISYSDLKSAYYKQFSEDEL